jgi:hypothetical protein
MREALAGRMRFAADALSGFADLSGELIAQTVEVAEYPRLG